MAIGKDVEVVRSDRRRWPLLVSLLSPIALVGVFLWCLHLSHPGLIEKSRFVFNTAQMRKGRRFYEDIGIQWLSRNEILFCTFDDPVKAASRVARTRNITTGSERELPGLTAAIDADDWKIVDNQCVSPDGRWFVRSGRWDNCLLASIDGSHKHIYPSLATDCYREIFWLSDSRHWIEAFGVNMECKKLVLHDVLAPGVSTSLPVSDQALLLGHLRAVPALSRAISIKLPEEEDTPQTEGKVTITQFDLLHPGSGSRLTTMAIPGAADGCTAHVSPDGTQIAWCAVSPAADPVRSILHKFRSAIDVHPFTQYVVYVSAPDGSGMREIGEVASKDPDDSLEIGWLPDGKSLTVEYGDSMYLVGVGK